MSRSPSQSTPDPQDIEAALDAFLGAETWDTKFNILLRDQAILLRDATLKALQQRITECKNQPERTGLPLDLLEQHLALLTAAERDGIDAAWAAFIAQVPAASVP